MKTKIRALKKLYFLEGSKTYFIRPGEYAEIDNKYLEKFLRLNAIEILDETNPPIKENSDEKELPDIVAVVEEMDSIEDKKELIAYAKNLGIEGLNHNLSLEEIKAAVINALEAENDV